jgi:hypothetical protein
MFDIDIYAPVLLWSLHRLGIYRTGDMYLYDARPVYLHRIWVQPRKGGFYLQVSELDNDKKILTLALNESVDAVDAAQQNAYQTSIRDEIMREKDFLNISAAGPAMNWEYIHVHVPRRGWYRQGDVFQSAGDGKIYMIYNIIQHNLARSVVCRELRRYPTHYLPGAKTTYTRDARGPTVFYVATTRPVIMDRASFRVHQLLPDVTPSYMEYKEKRRLETPYAPAVYKHMSAAEVDLMTK